MNLSPATREELIEELARRNPVPNSTELIAMAEREWHNREERSGLHEKRSWIAVYCTGFFSVGKPDWVATIRKEERERVLALVDNGIEHCANRSYCLHIIQEIREEQP